MTGRASWLRRIEGDAAITTALARAIVDGYGWVDFDDLAKRLGVSELRLFSALDHLERSGRVNVNESGRIYRGPAPHRTVTDGDTIE